MIVNLAISDPWRGYVLANGLPVKESNVDPAPAEALGALCGRHDCTGGAVRRSASEHPKAVFAAGETAHRQHARELSAGWCD